jgi:uncharacterized protein YndB with AHSA1/START domain
MDASPDIHPDLAVDADHPLGEVLRGGEAPVLRYRRTLRHPPEKVWPALVEKDRLAHWMPAWLDGDLHEGARIAVPFFPDVVAKYSIEQPVMRGEIRVWQPPRVLEWLWDTDLLRFELDPVEGPAGPSTLLTLTVRIDPAGVPPYQAGAGYHVCLAHLELLLDTGDAPSVAAADPAPVERQYVEAWGDS